MNHGAHVLHSWRPLVRNNHLRVEAQFRIFAENASTRLFFSYPISYSVDHYYFALSRSTPYFSRSLACRCQHLLSQAISSHGGRSRAVGAKNTHNLGQNYVVRCVWPNNARYPLRRAQHRTARRGRGAWAMQGGPFLVRPNVLSTAIPTPLRPCCLLLWCFLCCRPDWAMLLSRGFMFSRKSQPRFLKRLSLNSGRHL